jgi:hypothetical protein
MALWPSGDASLVVPLRRHLAPPFPATPPSPSLLYPAAPAVLRARGPPGNSACCKEDGVEGGRAAPSAPLSPSLPSLVAPPVLWAQIQERGPQARQPGPALPLSMAVELRPAHDRQRPRGPPGNSACCKEGVGGGAAPPTPSSSNDVAWPLALRSLPRSSSLLGGPWNRAPSPELRLPLIQGRRRPSPRLSFHLAGYPVLVQGPGVSGTRSREGATAGRVQSREGEAGGDAAHARARCQGPTCR